MLALSPQISNFGWFWEDPKTIDQNREHNYNLCIDQISNSINSDGLNSPSSNTVQPKHDDFSHFRSASIENGDESNVVKKLNHNACERDRRKKINTLYSTLRSLLPAEDQSKKLSIPATVSRVLKYIPELQEQVERLREKKEQLVSKISRQRGSFIDFTTRESRKKAQIRSSAASATRLNEREVFFQISTTKAEKFLFSEALFSLEEEGFLVLNASCFESFQGRIFNCMHLQGRGTLGMSGENYLMEKLWPFYEKLGEEEKLESMFKLDVVPRQVQ